MLIIRSMPASVYHLRLFFVKLIFMLLLKKRMRHINFKYCFFGVPASRYTLEDSLSVCGQPDREVCADVLAITDGLSDGSFFS